MVAEVLAAVFYKFSEKFSAWFLFCLQCGRRGTALGMAGVGLEMSVNFFIVE
jgi:hypothetical protein